MRCGSDGIQVGQRWSVLILVVLAFNLVCFALCLSLSAIAVSGSKCVCLLVKQYAEICMFTNARIIDVSLPNSKPSNSLFFAFVAVT